MLLFALHVFNVKAQIFTKLLIKKTLKCTRGLAFSEAGCKFYRFDTLDHRGSEFKILTRTNNKKRKIEARFILKRNIDPTP